MYILTI